MGKNPSFISRNLVAIVMIPSIIGIHYGWTLLQDNRTLIKEDEVKEAPFFAIPKAVVHRLTGSDEGKPTAKAVDAK